jgi:hypothetical protein
MQSVMGESGGALEYCVYEPVALSLHHVSYLVLLLAQDPDIFEMQATVRGVGPGSSLCVSPMCGFSESRIGRGTMRVWLLSMPQMYKHCFGAQMVEEFQGSSRATSTVISGRNHGFVHVGPAISCTVLFCCAPVYDLLRVRMLDCIIQYIWSHQFLLRRTGGCFSNGFFLSVHIPMLHWRWNRLRKGLNAPRWLLCVTSSCFREAWRM